MELSTLMLSLSDIDNIILFLIAIVKQPMVVLHADVIHVSQWQHQTAFA
jgi:hypothetical protein